MAFAETASPFSRLAVGPLLIGAATLGGLVFLFVAQSTRLGLLGCLGVLLGFALHRGSFGFTAGWRALSSGRSAAPFLAQLLLLGVAAALITGVVEVIGSTAFGGGIGYRSLPLGPSTLIGAFIFGIGMQLGNGCGSGTLFTLGGGSTRMIVTLLFFIAGAVIATTHLDWWTRDVPRALPLLDWGNLSLPRLLGPIGGLVATLGLLGLTAVAAWLWIRRSPDRERMALLPRRRDLSPRRLATEPWGLGVSVAVLAVLATLVFWISGSPWSVTLAFAVWGGKAVQALGGDLTVFGWWDSGWQRSLLLDVPVYAQTISVMDFGLILGAGLSALALGRFKPTLTIPWRSLLAAVLGGLMLGYGARLAFGCNIGAFFGGISSGDLQGWLWFVCAFAGSLIGVRLRPLFGLSRD